MPLWIELLLMFLGLLALGAFGYFLSARGLDEHGDPKR